MAYLFKAVSLLLISSWLVTFASADHGADDQGGDDPGADVQGADDHSADGHVHGNYSSQPDERARLREDLLRDYHKGIPPTHEGPIDVNLAATMTYFDFVDEANEMATIHAWVTESWKDPRLHWHPEDYNGTTTMVMDAKDIWIPDIESLDSASVTYLFNAKPIVNSTGDVYLTPSLQINFVCPMDFRFFPYDKQQCRLRFGSWHHHAELINLTANDYFGRATGRSPGRYTTVKDFRLTGVSVTKKTTKYPCCKEIYVDVVYTIDLTRTSGAYSTKLVLPSVLTGFLVLATFLLPPTSYEKITLCGILFLCLLLLLTYLHDIVPSSGDTILGEYLAFALFIDFFATILAVVSYNMNKPTRVPQRQLQFEMETEGDDNGFKMQMPRDRKKEWLRHLDSICFVLFTIVFIVGVAIILGRRE